MLKLEAILGLATEPDIAEALHHLEHHGQVEYLTLSEADTQRHRLRVLTDRGTECAIALPRHQHLVQRRRAAAGEGSCGRRAHAGDAVAGSAAA